MIRLVQDEELATVDALSVSVVNDMHTRGIKQWDASYPRASHFKRDIEAKVLYGYYINTSLIAVMALMDENETVYENLPWMKSRSFVIHRVLIDPSYHMQGTASKLFDFALSEARKKNIESIKIDTHPGNYRMRNFLKKHQYQEMNYIKAIHRIGYERLVESHANMNRILIFGSSGTGKTTLARMLGEKLTIPFLHLDAIYWEKDWHSKTKPEFARLIRNYMRKNDRFVMDGNYTNSVTFMERLQYADTVIILDYGIPEALKGLIEREQEYKHRFRSDMAEGCIENIDQEFLQYVINFTDKLRKIKACVNQYQGSKTLLTFKSRAALMQWFNAL